MRVHLIVSGLLAVSVSACIADPYASLDPAEVSDAEVDYTYRDARIRDAAVRDLTLETPDQFIRDARVLPPDVGQPVDAERPPPDAALPSTPPDWLPDRLIEDEIVADTLDVICLDAREYAPPGAFDTDEWLFEWIVVASPNGSTSVPVERFFNNAQPGNGGEQDDRSTPQACMFIDLAGSWRLRLRVTHIPSETTIELVELAVSTLFTDDITVQLVWNSPGDADQTDAIGTDLDLLLRHPNADRWTSGPWVCDAQNSAPDWGQPGANGDPMLDVDDTDGAGPENITISQAEVARYLVGVRFNASHPDVDPRGTEATVRIFIKGEPRFELSRTLEEPDALWPVAAIEWSDAPRVEALD